MCPARDTGLRFVTLIAGWIAAAVVGFTAFGDDLTRGILEGHLTIASPKEVELAAPENEPTANRRIDVQNYEQYPMVVSGKDGKEVARVTADAKGNYHVALSPGHYVLDVQGRGRGRIRATPQSFKVVARETVRVDMNIDTGIR